MDLTNEQEKRLGEYMTIKKRIKACFNMEKFIDIMRKSIDGAEDFEFSNPYNRKFINPKKPIFIMKTTLINGVNLKDLSEEELNEILGKVTRALAEQVVGNIEEKMMECLCDEKTFHELCEVDMDLVNLCISNVYKVRIDNYKNFVNLEYFDF